MLILSDGRRVAIEDVSEYRANVGAGWIEITTRSGETVAHSVGGGDHSVTSLDRLEKATAWLDALFGAVPLGGGDVGHGR